MCKQFARFVFAGIVLVATSAVADSPHFVKGPTASFDPTNGDYTVSFKEAGLGNTPITYELKASNANFTFQCFTKKNNAPQGSPNNVSFSDETVHTTLTPRNGQINGSITMSPQQDGASCQGNGLKLCLIAVSYSGVTFEDTTTPIGPFDMPDESANDLFICGF